MIKNWKTFAPDLFLENTPPMGTVLYLILGFHVQ